VSEPILFEGEAQILCVCVLAVDLYSYHRKNGGEQLSDFEFATVFSIFRPFEFELDAQLFRPVGRSFAFGFHLERRLSRRIESCGVATRLERNRVTGVEFIHDCLEVRCDLFSAHTLFGFEEDFLWHTASNYVTRVVKRMCALLSSIYSLSSSGLLLSSYLVRDEPEGSELQRKGMTVVHVHERDFHSLHRLGDFGIES
jgi:hypothetical protein